MNYQQIDKKALSVANQYRKTEAELLNIIMEVDRYRVFRRFGYSSLYRYVNMRLKVSESQTYALISVARKSREVPELKESIKKGRLSLNKAKRMTSVINKENQEEWIDKASHTTQKSLEREENLQGETTPSEKQPFPRKVNQQVKRKNIPANIKHQVFLRDHGRCTAIEPDGSRCSSRRFLEIHHIKPLGEGGGDSVDNLTLLCSGHHSVEHANAMTPIRSS